MGDCEALEVSVSDGYLRLRNVSSTPLTVLKVEFSYRISVHRAWQSDEVRGYATKTITESSAVERELKPGDEYSWYVGLHGNVLSVKVLYRRGPVYECCEWRFG